MMACCNTSIPNVLSIYFVPPSIRHNLLFSPYTHCILWFALHLSHSVHIHPIPENEQICNGRQIWCCLRGNAVLEHCKTLSPSRVPATCGCMSCDGYTRLSLYTRVIVCVWHHTHDIAGGLTGTCRGTSDSTGQLGRGGRSHSGTGH